MDNYSDVLTAISEIIRSSPSPLLLAEDFTGDWDEPTVTLVLQALVTDRVVVLLAEGVYGRTYYNPVYQRAILQCPMFDLVRLYLARIGVRIVPTDEEYAAFKRFTIPERSDNVIGVSHPVATVFFEFVWSGTYTFEYIPDGLERLTDLGVEYLYDPIDLSSERLQRYDPLLRFFPD